ncbi:MFS general substrate transporter [Pleomassaria siparia CBS 279.74]|uniref:MFS general substrate transporter n=1 Tax=Pleomassaria siparia CBS 279.74 TaxID=1314801 RepID=A0A6G1KR51_9PLEO|nr:MFS general substrate transporter [Pleomassaria siparia CBS 279.74]
MAQRSTRLPTTVRNEERYPDCAPSDLANAGSYEEFRQVTEGEAEDNSAPLRKSFRQYSALVWWMLAMATAFLYGGYDSVVLGTLNAVPAYQRDFGDWIQDPNDAGESKWIIPATWLSLWDGIGPLGQLAGTVLGGWLLDRMGRRFCLLVGSIIAAIAVLVLFLSNMPEDKTWRRSMILIGKVVQGFGLGIVKVEAITYMSEVVPVSLKGAVMSLVPTFSLLGQLIGAVVIFAVSGDDRSSSYMIALGSQWVLALPPFILAFVMPESPAYLLKKRNTRDALTSFTRLLGPKNNPMSALYNMEITMEEELKDSATVSYANCFKGPNRRRTFIIIFASSIELLFGLSLLSTVSYFLQQLGMDASQSIIFLIAGVIFCIVANACSAWTVSHIGRRKLSITSLLITAGLWTLMGFSGIKPSSATPWLAGGLCTAIVVTCGLGCWPASYAIGGETSSLRLRPKSLAIGRLANNLFSTAMNFVLPYLFNPDAANLGAKTGFLFTITSSISAVLIYFYVPELKGRSALEIDRFFGAGVKARGSTKWRHEHDEIPSSAVNLK